MQKNTVHVWNISLLVGAVALICRLISMWYFPEPHQFDGYQRWAGRDHLYVQVWLPATQLWVWLIAKLGGTLLVLRLFFSLLASVTIVLATRVGLELFSFAREESEDNPSTTDISLSYLPLAFVPFACLGPYIVWSTVPYQESTFLFFWFLGLLLYRKYPRWSDLCIGALALVRYEGWPLVVVHSLLGVWLRKDNRVLLSLWGIVLWLAIRYFGLLEPYMASPDSFSDWKDLHMNLRFWKIRHLLFNLWGMFDSAAADWWIFFSVFALGYWRKNREHFDATQTSVVWMTIFAFLGQMAALLGWVLSLGVAFSRMVVLPTLLLSPFSAMGILILFRKIQDKYQKQLTRRVMSGVFGLLLFAFTAWSLRDARLDLTNMNKQNQDEREIAQIMEQCSGDIWGMYPRQHPGPRSRHDGCEVIQGITMLRAGEDFNCLQWGWGGPSPTLVATWNDKEKQYDISRIAGTKQGDCPY